MGYAYQASVSIPAPTSGTLTNFTAVIKVVDATLLKPSGSGGQITNSGAAFTSGPTVPFDLVVSSDTAITSLYSWTIKSWDQTNGIVYIYLLIPSYTGALTVYVSIGNSSTTTWQGGTRGACFDSNTSLAILMADGITLSVVDFSSAIMNGSNTAGTVAAAAVDGGISMNGTSAFVSISGITASTAFSWSMWIKPANNSAFHSLIGGANGSFGLRVDTSGHVFGTKTATGDDTVSTGTLSTSAFNHVAFVQTSANAYTYYLNGAASGSFTSGQNAFSVATTTIGKSASFGEFTPCIMSDVMYAATSTARPANWWATLYANGSSIPLAGAFSAIVTGGTNFITTLGAM